MAELGGEAALGVANALRSRAATVPPGNENGIACADRHPEHSEGPHTGRLITRPGQDARLRLRSPSHSFGMTEERLENEDGVADTDEVFHARGIPVRKANAAVTRGASDCLGIVRAVNPDAGLVQTHPKNAN
jgi:hypothetical protein